MTDSILTSSPRPIKKDISKDIIEPTKTYFFQNSSGCLNSACKSNDSPNPFNQNIYVTGDETDNDGLLTKLSFKNRFENLRNRTSFIVDLIFAILFLLATLIGIYTLVFLCHARFIKKSNSSMVRNQYSSYFYEIDVQRFQDSNKDGLGDYRGIEQNIQYLKMLGVSTVLLTKLVLDRTEKYRSLQDLNNLISTFHLNQIKVICDLTPFIDNKTLDSTGLIFIDFTAFDGFYIFFNVSSDNPNDLLKFISLNGTSTSVVKSWYIGLFPLNEKSIYVYSMFLRQLGFSNIKGFIHRINLPDTFDQRDRNSVQTFYTFLINIYQMVSENNFPKENIFYVDSKQVSIYNKGLFLYPYFYAAIGFSPCHLMLKAGQEFIEGNHVNRNYSEKMEKALKFKISYIDYFLSLKKARNMLEFNPPEDWTTQTWGSTGLQAFIRNTKKPSKKIVAFYNLGKSTTFNQSLIFNTLNISKKATLQFKVNDPRGIIGNSSNMEHLNIYYAYLN